jgi:carbon storage regulator CsrA
MLVLTRKQDQEILIGDQIKITVLKARGNTVRLGIEAPRDIKVVRGELEPEPSSHADREDDDGAEFTIVFGSDTEADSEPGDDHCVQFKSDRKASSKLPSSELPRKNKSVNRLTKDPDAASIRFEGRLPRVLKHNRLKEIVERIAVDKAVTSIKE